MPSMRTLLIMLPLACAAGCGGLAIAPGDAGRLVEDSAPTDSSVPTDSAAPIDGWAETSSIADGSVLLDSWEDDSTVAESSAEASADSGGPPGDASMVDCYSTQMCIHCTEDDLWHCQDLVMPQCPPNVPWGSSCAGYNSSLCLDCQDGAAVMALCNTDWSMDPLGQSCSQ